MSRGGFGSFSTTPTNSEGRIQVDPGQTSLFEGREFRLKRTITLSSGQTIWLKFVSLHDFELFFQSFDVYGEIDFKAYRSSQGVESGAFSGSFAPVANNIMPNRPKISAGGYFESGVTITYGGVFTPYDPLAYTDTEVIRSSQATSGRASVSRESGTERRLAAGTYYLKLQNTDNSASTVVTYNLSWGEEP